MSPGAWGREYAQDIEQYRNTVCMWIVSEDMPQEANGVTLHPSEKDQHGLPIPIVHFKDHPNDLAMRNHAFRTGGDVYRAAGALKVYERGPFSSTHNMGTCRQSAKPADGVCNKFGQTHDIPNLFISDGSQFTTGAAENPTLTIVALAIRRRVSLRISCVAARCEAPAAAEHHRSVAGPGESPACACESPALCARSASRPTAGSRSSAVWK